MECSSSKRFIFDCCKNCLTLFLMKALPSIVCTAPVSQTTNLSEIRISVQWYLRNKKKFYLNSKTDAGPRLCLQWDLVLASVLWLSEPYSKLKLFWSLLLLFLHKGTLHPTNVIIQIIVMFDIIFFPS